MFDKMKCRKCDTVNPMVYVAPVTVADKQGFNTVVCMDCAEKMRWLDKDGNIKKDIIL